ncbi:MAG TPA: DinB family protein, partial [Candidatus Kapabacteria bacterium]|nr:DinB family protein [Candidatus Kapabacteria bacterium]
MYETKIPEAKLPEPWLRGTLTDIPAAQRAVLHALEGAKEDLERWCGALTDEQLKARPAGIAPVAFHIRHISRSTDRLLTYAEGQQLSGDQLAVLKTELDPGATSQSLFTELSTALDRAAARVRAFTADQLNDSRGVGKK